jgi:hypothetical protein
MQLPLSAIPAIIELILQNPCLSSIGQQMRMAAASQPTGAVESAQERGRVQDRDVMVAEVLIEMSRKPNVFATILSKQKESNHA